MKPTFIVPLAGLALGFHVYNASAQFSDNFDSGTDAAWTRWAPTTSPSPAGTPLSPSYSFPASTQGGLGYQMSSQVSTGGVNAYVRVGSSVTGLLIPDFFVSVALIDWDNTLAQNMGVMARVTTPIGVLPLGYGFGYVNRYSGVGTGTDQLRIWRLDNFSQINADPNGVANGSVGQFSGPGANPPPNPATSTAPVPGRDYELRFWGIGSNLYGQMVDLSTGQPLLVSDGNGGLTDTVRAVNGVFTTGTVGLWSVTAELNINPTFDNFYATVVPEPSTWLLAGLGLLGLVLRNVRRS